MNFIGEWYLKDTSICDNLIDFFNNSDYSCHRKSGSLDGGLVDETIKKSLDLSIPTSECTQIKLFRDYLDELSVICEKYKEKYPLCTEVCDFWKLEKIFNIQYYEPGGGFYKIHTERSSNEYPGCHRHLVFMTYLNDVTDGGETEFINQSLKIKPQKGKTLIWPADWTHTHRGIPSPTQEKYIVTGWYTFDL